MENWTLRFDIKDRVGFEAIQAGLKTIETRAASIKYQSIQTGDTLTFVCGEDRFDKEVLKMYHWQNIEEMVKEVPLEKIAPFAKSIQELKEMYASFPGYEEKIRQFGLLGFELK